MIGKIDVSKNSYRGKREIHKWFVTVWSLTWLSVLKIHQKLE